MTAVLASDVLWIGDSGSVSEPLAAALECASRVDIPFGHADDTTAASSVEVFNQRLVEWRRSASGSQPEVGGVVVAAVGAALAPGKDEVARVPIIGTTLEQWRVGFESPLKLWFTALQLASDVCRDGGSIVVVVDGAPSLDIEGQGPAVALADGLATAARSLALSEGERGVRVNCVSTPVITERGRPGPFSGFAPPIGYPGEMGGDLVGAVRMLLSDDARAITGSTIRADYGRSWV